MDISTLNSPALSALNSAADPTSQAIGVAMLSNQLDVTEMMGTSMVKAMENSVNPAVGSNFDMTI